MERRVSAIFSHFIQLNGQKGIAGGGGGGGGGDANDSGGDVTHLTQTTAGLTKEF